MQSKVAVRTCAILTTGGTFPVEQDVVPDVMAQYDSDQPAPFLVFPSGADTVTIMYDAFVGFTESRGS